jgi:transcriptional antiterminator NusG
MDMQEPEEQRLEDEPMEPAEEVSEPSDEPVLSDTDASEPGEEPASISSSEDETEKNSAEEEAEGEPTLEVSSDDEEEATVDEEIVAETPTAEDEGEEKVSAEEQAAADMSTTDEVEAVPSETESGTAPEADDDPSAWFVVHCYSGYENKVRHNLEQRIETMGMKDMIFDIVVPTEEEIEVKEGKRRTVERRVFPGYILVNMVMTEESWYVVRNTPGVTGFVGMGTQPTPLRSDEVSQIIRRMEAEAPRIKVTFKSGERVRIVDGPFNDFRGTVAEIDMERAKVRVMVNFFGRETPVELDFLQVEKT